MQGYGFKTDVREMDNEAVYTIASSYIFTLYARQKNRTHFYLIQLQSYFLRRWESAFGNCNQFIILALLLNYIYVLVTKRLAWIVGIESLNADKVLCACLPYANIETKHTELD